MIPKNLSDKELYDIVSEQINYHYEKGILVRYSTGKVLSSKNAVVSIKYVVGDRIMNFSMQPKEVAWLLYHKELSKCVLVQIDGDFSNIAMSNLSQGRLKSEKYIAYLSRPRKYRLSLGNVIPGIKDYYFDNKDDAVKLKACIVGILRDYPQYCAHVLDTNMDRMYVNVVAEVNGVDYDIYFRLDCKSSKKLVALIESILRKME